jgi:hypothetical protein
MIVFAYVYGPEPGPDLLVVNGQVILGLFSSLKVINNSPPPSPITIISSVKGLVPGGNNFGLTRFVGTAFTPDTTNLNAYQLIPPGGGGGGGGAIPGVSALVPSSGSTAGGTSVSMTGSNLTGATAVEFPRKSGQGVKG